MTVSTWVVVPVTVKLPGIVTVDVPVPSVSEVPATPVPILTVIAGMVL